MTGNRIVVLTNGNYFARIILEDLLTEHRFDIAGILVVTGDYKARGSLHALLAIGRSTSPPYFWYKLVSYAFFKLAQRWYPDTPFSVEARAKELGIAVQRQKAVNSTEAQSWISSLNADLIVSVSCPQLVRRDTLALAHLGGINIHSSLLPSYAGLAPYYWVLSNGEKETGTTVHYMTRKFDEGNILVQRKTMIAPQESAFGLFHRLSHLGREAICTGTALALEGTPGIKQDLTRYSYFSHPDLRSHLQLRRSGHSLFRVSELFAAVRSERERTAGAEVRNLHRS